MWLGSAKNPPGASHKKVINFGGLYNGLPRFDKKEFGSTANYVREMAKYYPGYSGRDLPEVDCVFVRALPSFIYENAKIYIMLYQYGLRGTPVFVRDLELLMVKRFIVAENNHDRTKPFGVSGSDNAFDKNDWEVMANNLHILAPYSWGGLRNMLEWAPHLQHIMFHFPYDEKLYPTLPYREPSRYVTYIGNDTGRRQGFSKYFRHLPDRFVHVYGGQARQVDKGEKGFPANFKKRFPNIAWHDAVPHHEVNGIYNKSACCMSIPKPYFNKVGFASARFMEAVFSGAVLVLPCEFVNAEYYTTKRGLVATSLTNLRTIARNMAKDVPLRHKILNDQREVMRKIGDVKRNVERVLGVVK